MVDVAYTHYALALLDNVVIFDDEIELTPNLKLFAVKLLESGNLNTRTFELLEHALDNRMAEVQHFPALLPPTCALLYRSEQDTTVFTLKDNFSWIARRAIDNVLAAFQITKAGSFGRYHIHELHELLEINTNPRILPSSFILSTDMDKLFIPIESDQVPFVLENDDIRFLQRILETQSRDTLHVIRIILTRLNKHFAREEFADQFLDAVIALEALYLFGITGELQHRLGLRLAAHLGKNEDERDHLYKLAGAVYTIRSKIAHGEVFTLEETDKNENIRKELKRGNWSSSNHVLNELIEILRSAVRSVLVDIGEMRFKTHFHAALDDAIIRGRPFAISDFHENKGH